MSNLPGQLAQPFSRNLPEARAQNMDWLSGANRAGVSVQSARVVQVGASPFTVDLAATPGLDVMKDDQYSVFVTGMDGALGVATYLQADMLAGSFIITGGADTNVYQVVILGALADQVE